ncbi:MAG: hypothetical protein M1825_002112 [Sarcosagium campestre]|nr:MAG: hypothetical protein M1825_002112 [Sarcosagium campestre]
MHWTTALTKKFKKSNATALAKLQAEKYTVADARRRKDPADYVHNVVRRARAAGFERESQQLTLAYNALEPELRALIDEPDDETNLEEFLKAIDRKKNAWFEVHAPTSPPSPPEDSTVHVIGYDVITLGEHKEIETAAKSTLISTLKSTEYRAAGNDNVYGNLRGPAVLSDKYDLSQGRRNRFLDNYRGDVTYNLDYDGRNNIAEGNEAACHGDAVTDAALYTSRERADNGILIEIYGIDPVQMTSLAKAGDFEAIKVLNTGGTWRANQSKVAVPPDVEAAFKMFTREIRYRRSSGPCKESLTDGKTTLGKAYYLFWAAHKAHEKR